MTCYASPCYNFEFVNAMKKQLVFTYYIYCRLSETVEKLKIQFIMIVFLALAASLSIPYQSADFRVEMS